MAMRKILVDETNRELCEHGTAGFPMTVNHDDLWAFEGKSVPIHWHNDLEISVPREGEAIYQVYQKSYTVRPGDALVLNRNVPHSCHSPNSSHARYSTFLARPDFIYGEYDSWTKGAECGDSDSHDGDEFLGDDRTFFTV